MISVAIMGHGVVGSGVAEILTTHKQKLFASIDVYKRQLLSRACDEVGLEGIKPVLEGTTALATSDSEYAAAARISGGIH